MLASLLIVFREVLEAGLVVGIVLAATVGIANRALYIAGGIAAGIAGAALLAVFAGALTNALSGNGQEVFDAAILIVAVVMLGWHNVWMASHGREMAHQFREMGHAIAKGETSLMAMAIVVAVAVLREGSEVVLFLYGIAASADIGLVAMLLGGALGVLGGAVISWVIYRGLITIPLHRLFGVTSVLISLLAAGMAGRAVAILAGADLLPAWGYQIWDTSWLVDDGSLVGRALQALVGYTAQPIGIQLVAWVATLAVLIGASRYVHNRPASTVRDSKSTPAQLAKQR
jgi:high-affinity iron transporter